VADAIELKPFVGGMLSVVLTTYRTNGTQNYSIVEEVMFDKGLVTAIEVFTEFDSCRTSKEDVAHAE
jgi:hypothetical protein